MNKAIKDKKADMISQMKKGAEPTKQSELNDNDDWERMDSEEEETPQEKRGVVSQQSKGASDKPKNISELLKETSTKQRTQARQTKKPQEE